jgi:hypothetical protein
VLDALRGDGAWSVLPIAAGVSRGDLGYTYGTAERRAKTGGPVAAAHAYLRVWRMRADGQRVVVLEASSPIPLETK